MGNLILGALAGGPIGMAIAGGFGLLSSYFDWITSKNYLIDFYLLNYF